MVVWPLPAIIPLCELTEPACLSRDGNVGQSQTVFGQSANTVPTRAACVSDQAFLYSSTFCR